jgi:hypothetical protein
VSLGESCGGAVVRLLKMPRDASSPHMSLKKMMMIKMNPSLMTHQSTKTEMLDASVVKKKVI